MQSQLLRARPARSTHADSALDTWQTPFVRSCTLDLVTTKAEGAHAVRSLGATLLHHSLVNMSDSIPSYLETLEHLLSQHQPSLRAALGAANPTTESVKRYLERDVIRSAINGAGGAGGIGGVLPGAALPADAVLMPPPESAVAQAMRSQRYKDLETTKDTSDLESDAGLFDLLEHALDGHQLLPMRVLFNTSAAGDPLSKRDALLGALNDKRSRVDDFANFVMKLDVATGVEDPRFRKYSIARTPFMMEFKRQNFRSVPWVSAPGLLTYLQHRDSKAAAVTLPQADLYCIPSVMEDLAPYGQKMFSGLYGFRVDVDVRDGFSWHGACIHFAEHLKLAARLESREEQLTWIDYAVSRWYLCLDIMSETVKELLHSSDVAQVCMATYSRPPYQGGGPHVVVNRPLLRADAEPLKDLRDRRDALEKTITHRHDHDVFGAPSGATKSYDDVQLPRLSSKKRPAQEGNEGSKKQVKKLKAAETSATAPEGSAGAPGSQLKSWKEFTQRGGERFLVISGRTWHVTNLCKHLKINESDFCGPYALCRANSIAGRAARCPKWGDPKHGPPGAGAHRIVDVNDESLKPFWREATDKDKQGIVPVVPHAAAGRGGRGDGGRGRGGRGGKGKGKGKGGGRGRGGRGGDADPAAVEAGKGQPALW